MSGISRALISVSDKSGVVEFAKGLSGFGVEILSTGGTFVTLRAAEILAVEVSHYTGFPEMLDGRVKTLHPKIHGGILARRDDPTHQMALSKNEIPPIDLVVVNLYPFERTVAKEGVELDEAIEQIDIGGPTLLRAAAKNWEFVTAIVDPADYPRVLGALRDNGGTIPREMRFEFAKKVFALTARYDSAIVQYLHRQGESGEKFPPRFSLEGQKLLDLRYGENPHQHAALYQTGEKVEASVANAKLLNGKALSYNNILDLESALNVAKDFESPVAVVIKHNNPCGCTSRIKISQAIADAWEGDALSAFGSVIACNRELDRESAEFLVGENRFVEAVIAPSFSKEAFSILTTKPKWGKSVRLLETGPFVGQQRDANTVEVRKIYGGFLVQTRDHVLEHDTDCKVVTKKSPTPQQIQDLLFAQKLAKHVRSNAIVLAKNQQLLGVGAGQMSRVDSVKLAISKAGTRIAGSVMGSDAFFPFPDGIEEAARAGVAAVIQPGGSVKDTEAIAAADQAGIAMVFTGIRHFLH